ncbi:MAG: hypothetical protein QNJ47_27900 [Nostocaceae cyanobacterium]|nr:hypothetical protein [Nostocaceae cyanobacterium]
MIALFPPRRTSLYAKKRKVCLSGNSKDFGKSKVQEALPNAGVDKYFIRTQNFLGWLYQFEKRMGHLVGRVGFPRSTIGYVAKFF